MGALYSGFAHYDDGNGQKLSLVYPASEFQRKMPLVMGCFLCRHLTFKSDMEDKEISTGELNTLFSLAVRCVSRHEGVRVQ